MNTLAEYLPTLALAKDIDDFTASKGSMSVRLHEVCDMHKIVHEMFMALGTDEVLDKEPLPKLQKIIRDNTFRVSGDPTKSSKIIFPKDYKGDPLDYFRGTPLAELFSARIPINIPEEARFMGHWIVAPSGKGKTTLLLNMLLEDIEKDACIILMDAKGELVNEVRHWQCLKDRLVVIDPDAEHPIQLNPLDSAHGPHAVDNLEYLFSTLLQTGLTPKQQALFRSGLRATLCFPNPTLRTFRDIIKEGLPNTSNLPLPEDLKDFFDTEFPTTTYKETRQEIQWRLRLMMENPALRAMFTAPKTLLDLGELMDAGKVVVIDNTKAKVGEGGSEFFGRFFLFLILNEAVKRSGRKGYKKPVYVYIDEANKVIRRDESFETLLDTCRSERIGFVVAHQRVAQIEAKVLDALANCGIRMGNVEEDAVLLAPKLRTTAETLRGLSRGQFATVVRDYGAYTLAVEKAAMPAHMTAEEEQVLQQRTRAKYCERVPPQTMVRPDAPRQVIDPDKLSTDAKKDW